MNFNKRTKEQEEVIKEYEAMCLTFARKFDQLLRESKNFLPESEKIIKEMVIKSENAERVIELVTHLQVIAYFCAVINGFSAIAQEMEPKVIDILFTMKDIVNKDLTDAN